MPTPFIHIKTTIVDHINVNRLDDANIDGLELFDQNGTVLNPQDAKRDAIFKSLTRPAAGNRIKGALWLPPDIAQGGPISRSNLRHFGRMTQPPGNHQLQLFIIEKSPTTFFQRLQGKGDYHATQLVDKLEATQPDAHQDIEEQIQDIDPSARQRVQVRQQQAQAARVARGREQIRQQAANPLNNQHNVHAEHLADSNTGYPKIFYQLTNEQQSHTLSYNDVQAQIGAEATSALKSGELSAENLEKVNGALEYMLGPSGAGDSNVIDWPEGILLKDVIAQTWTYIVNNTEEGGDLRKESVGALLERLVDSNGWCNTGHASRVIQSLTTAFPDTFAEPLTFAQAQSDIISVSKELLKTIVAESHSDADISTISENDELVAQIKSEYDEKLNDELSSKLPSVPSEYFAQQKATQDGYFTNFLDLALSDN